MGDPPSRLQHTIEIKFFSEPSYLSVVELLLPPLKTNHRGHKEHKERRIGGWGRLSTVRAARGLDIALTRLNSSFIRPNPGAPRVGYFPAAAFLTDHINSRATYSTRRTSVGRGSRRAVAVRTTRDSQGISHLIPERHGWILPYNSISPAQATPIPAIEIKSFSEPSELSVFRPLPPLLKTNNRGLI